MSDVNPMKVQSIPIKDIVQSENSRTVYKETDTTDLMHSLKKDGQLQPVSVRKMKNGKWDLVFGNRRFLAAKRLGWNEIHATILDLANDADSYILNLVENLKRQNTSVQEDGRMFQILIDEGLNEGEIAVRLDISKERVRTALEVIRTIPKEYRSKIVNRFKGSKAEGQISATAAHSILNARRSHDLNAEQTKKLLEFASRKNASTQHIAQIAPLLKQGHSVDKAIKQVDRLQRIPLMVFMPRSTVDKLEKTRNKSINDILLAQLEKNPELQVSRGISKPKTILKKA